MPEPHPSSCGRISHGMPFGSTNMMPKACRSAKRGLPTLGFAFGLGMNGSMSSHNLVGRTAAAIEHFNRRRPRPRRSPAAVAAGDRSRNQYSALYLGSSGGCWLVVLVLFGGSFLGERKIWGTCPLQHSPFPHPADERRQCAYDEYQQHERNPEPGGKPALLSCRGRCSRSRCRGSLRGRRRRSGGCSDCVGIRRSGAVRRGRCRLSHSRIG